VAGGEDRRPVFFDFFFREAASEDEIDDWHDLPEGSGQSSPDHIGMTGEECGVFAKDRGAAADPGCLGDGLATPCGRALSIATVKPDRWMAVRTSFKKA
jgi:hypothetical protein